MIRSGYFIFLSLLAIAAQPCAAQSKRSAHWFFGRGAGIDFSPGTAVADTNSTIYTIEGCASISDTAGNLLFYSDGPRVWNRNHVLMPNGTGLLGNVTSVQSSLAVPFPGHPQQYYIFTVGPDFAYSIVDMTLDGGLGDIVLASKNTLLFTGAGEDVAGTLHCNAVDYWIVARKRNSSSSFAYQIYLLDSTGLSAPLSYPMNRQNHHPGQLLFSQDGTLLSASMQTSKNYIFGFDRQTGTLTLQDSMAPPSGPGDWFYSAAFSPDNSKIYASYWDANGHAFISQFDRNAPNLTASRIDLDSVPFNGSTNGYGWIGRMQLASDQRIYISRWAMPNTSCPDLTNYCIDSLDVIFQPDSAGFACNHQRSALSLDGKPTMIRLPSFISQFTAPGIPQNSCVTIGIAEPEQKNDFAAFPNPFRGRTQIRLGQFEKNSALEIYDAAGSLVKKQLIPAAQFYFEAEGLESGMYFCRIQLSDRVLSGKLVIMD